MITARDSGGTLEFVTDGVNGFVVEPDPEAIAAAIVALDADRRRDGVARRRRTRSGGRRSPGIAVIDRLLSHG